MWDRGWTKIYEVLPAAELSGTMSPAFIVDCGCRLALPEASVAPVSLFAPAGIAHPFPEG
jgi:hypothetical protein